MSFEISEIKKKKDAERLSKTILDSLSGGEVTFNPFRGRIIERDDGTISFMGSELPRQRAVGHLAEHIWENRKRVNKELKKWQIAGPGIVDCGC